MVSWVVGKLVLSFPMTNPSHPSHLMMLLLPFHSQSSPKSTLPEKIASTLRSLRPWSLTTLTISHGQTSPNYYESSMHPAMLNHEYPNHQNGLLLLSHTNDPRQSFRTNHCCNCTSYYRLLRRFHPANTGSTNSINHSSQHCLLLLQTCQLFRLRNSHSNHSTNTCCCHHSRHRHLLLQTFHSFLKRSSSHGGSSHYSFLLRTFQPYHCSHHIVHSIGYSNCYSSCSSDSKLLLATPIDTRILDDCSKKKKLMMMEANNCIQVVCCTHMTKVDCTRVACCMRQVACS